MKRPFASIMPEQLDSELADLGTRPFVAAQILRAVYQRNARSFDEMTDVPQDFRRALADRYALRTLEMVKRHKSPDGSFKLVLRLRDGHLIECAYLASGRRGTACISSQVGCRMGCIFCASGANGLVRNLEPAEMVEQVLLVRDHLGRRALTGVTVMGIGEPLANLDNVLAALELVNAPRGLAIGARKITISTCGLAAGIRRLAEWPVQVHLAISLHAAGDALRRRLMPEAAKVPVAELIGAARDYVRRTHRKVAFEVVLIRGVNDDLRHAEQLARLLGDFPSMVNLIPLNPTGAAPDLAPPGRTQAGRFLAVLKRAGIDACLRRRKGAAVEAACGQLRATLTGRPDGRPPR